MKQIADTTTLLSYAINVSLSFIIAIAGAFVREVYHYKKKPQKDIVQPRKR